jgi:hypothetical protein
MKIRSLKFIAADVIAPTPDEARRSACKMIAVAALTLGLAGVLAANGAVAAEKTGAERDRVPASGVRA